MADPAHEAADRAVEAFKAEVREVYLQAETDAQEVFSAFLARFEEKDAAMRAKVEAGELSRDDWLRWRKSAMLVGKRHASVLEQAARACSHANEAAMAALSGRLPEVYAENANFAAFEVCRESGLDLSFDLVDADAVRHMLDSGEAVLPAPSVDVPKDLAWNRKLVASQLTQGVLLGESIPKLAKRVQRVAGSNYATAVRTARTAVTGAENAGRVSSYRRAQAMGIDVEQEWLATLDGRTRHSHRKLDGERAPVGGKFSNGCRYPGDPEAAYAETMNCRCTLVPAVAGIDQSDAYRWSRLPAGMTYEQWKAGKEPPRESHSRARKEEPVRWENGAVSALPDADAVRAYVEERYGANVLASFSGLPVEKQRAAVAGIDAAAARYGRPGIANVRGFSSRSLDGKFAAGSGSIFIAEECRDAYVAGFHECIHAIDAEKSAHLEKRKAEDRFEWYNVHSSRVVEGARRGLKISKNSRSYRDALTEIFGNDLKLYAAYKDDPGEIAAYAIEMVEFRKPNKFADAIAEGFRK